MDTEHSHRKTQHKDGDIHFLTFSTFRCQPFFPGTHAANWFIEFLAKARERCPFRLFAYVIMPEHIHLILRPGDGISMRKIYWHLKRPMTDKVVTWVKIHHPTFLNRMADKQPTGDLTYRFWQRGGGYDRWMRTPSDLHEKIRYIHMNPVRSGLVSRPEEWKYSSAAEWIWGEPGMAKIDWDDLPPADG
ncbi:MAG: hypothetical protein HN909_06780 [Phycisphaerales bacterium]|jgi:putative transposase|nr:hypothetical protein [Phycisphaerales bacterium]MBT7171458.1 hypothetical protein [Phycisphaerales bacterium]